MAISLSLPFIEDYLELIAGYTNAQGKSTLSPFGGVVAAVPAIRLARYDVNVTESMASQTFNGQSLTDKQGALAHKIVCKYQKQLLAQGFDISDQIENPKFRHALRQIDRTRRLYIDGDHIVLKFAYDKDLISAVGADAKSSQGTFRFNREEKFWELSLTEYNLSWAVTFGQLHQFIIDPEVSRLMQLITDCEQVDYRIELTTNMGDVTITNAEPSLFDHIDKNLGGMGINNLLTLVDYSSILGYTVDASIQGELVMRYQPRIANLIQNHQCHWARNDAGSSGEDMLAQVVEYATLTNRWPIYIYEPDASDRLRETAKNMFAPEEFYDHTNKKSSNIIDFSGMKCVYFNKLKRTWDQRIPLLISTHAMLHGSEKQHMLQQAEKVIYYTASTYSEAKRIAG